MGPVWPGGVVCGWGVVSFSFPFQHSPTPAPPPPLSSLASRSQICLWSWLVTCVLK